MSQDLDRVSTHPKLTAVVLISMFQTSYKTTERLTAATHCSFPCLFKINKCFESLLGQSVALGLLYYPNLLYFITLFISFRALISRCDDLFFIRVLYCIVLYSTLHKECIWEIKPPLYNCWSLPYIQYQVYCRGVVSLCSADNFIKHLSTACL